MAVQKEDRKGFAASPEKEPKSRGEKPVSARRVLFLLSYLTPDASVRIETLQI